MHWLFMIQTIFARYDFYLKEDPSWAEIYLETALEEQIRDSQETQEYARLRKETEELVTQEVRRQLIECQQIAAL